MTKTTYETNESDKPIDAREAFQGEELDGFLYTMNRLSAIKDKIEWLDKHKKALQESLLDLMGEHDVEKVTCGVGTVFLVGESERRTLDRKKLLGVFSRYGVPVEEMSKAEKVAKIKAGVRVRLKNGEK